MIWYLPDYRVGMQTGKHRTDFKLSYENRRLPQGHMKMSAFEVAFLYGKNKIKRDCLSQKQPFYRSSGQLTAQSAFF